MANDKGFIMTDRGILETWLWEGNTEPFDKRSAFQYMQFQANYKDKTIMLKGTKRPFTICKGSFLTSIEKLANTWHWSKGKVKRFLGDLIDTDMIRVDGYTYGTLVTLVNISKTATRRPADGPTDRPTDEPENGSTDRTTDRPADVTHDRPRHNKDKYRNKDNIDKDIKHAPREGIAFVWGDPEE